MQHASILSRLPLPLFSFFLGSLMSVVAALKHKRYDETLTEKLLEGITEYVDNNTFNSLISAEAIAVKINLCDARTPDTGAVTHPKFLDCLLSCVERINPSAQIYVVESDSIVAHPDLFIRWFGIKRILNKHQRATYINLSRAGVRLIRFNEIAGFHLRFIPASRFLLEKVDFLITLPKLKTNILTKITCCLKNQFGCIPLVNKHKFHPVIDDAIALINLVHRPKLCVVDGIVGMVGLQGPAYGIPKRFSLILLGSDPVAIDSLVARILGFKPTSIGHIVKAKKLGLGSTKYEILGDEAHVRHLLKYGRRNSEIAPLEFLTMRFMNIIIRYERTRWRRGL